MEYNMMLMSDFYKQGHPGFYPDGLNYLFTCGTPRMSRLTGINEMVVWGIQGYVKDYLIEKFNTTFFNRPKQEVLDETVMVLNETFKCKAFNIQRIADLHDLGYLPVRVWTIPEGRTIPIINQKENPGVVQIPFMAFESTHPKFAWVAEFLESITSAQVWYPMVIATIAKKGYRDVVHKHWENSVVGQPERVAISEFGFRGAEGSEGAIMASAAFLTSFDKTATLPAIMYLKNYYGKGMTYGEIGSGMSSTEHSVMCSNYAVDKDEDTFMLKLFTEIEPEGNVSCVSDSYDYWARVKAMCADGALKSAILGRDGCLYVRGDSGRPEEIIAGKGKYKLVNDYSEIVTASNTFNLTSEDIEEYYKVLGDNKFDYYKVYKRAYNRAEYIDKVDPDIEDLGTVEALYNSYGGYINDKGYIVLNNKVRAIYGDSITPYLTDKIYTMLENAGFAANNVALGAGSFSMQAWEEYERGQRVLKPHTRDTFGIAFKATYCEINGEGHQIFKNPKTDSNNFKKSQRGMVVVLENEDGTLYAVDGLDRDKFNRLSNNNVMRPIFEDGKLLVDDSLREIRLRLNNNF